MRAKSIWTDAADTFSGNEEGVVDPSAEVLKIWFLRLFEFVRLRKRPQACLWRKVQGIDMLLRDVAPKLRRVTAP